MTIRMGVIRGRELRLTGEGPEDRGGHPCGKIYPVNPQAVENLRQVLAERAAAKAACNIQREVITMRRSSMSDEEIIAVHRRYVMEGISIATAAKDTPIIGGSLSAQFSRLNLPKREIGTDKWSEQDLARICEVHDVSPDNIPSLARKPKPRQHGNHRRKPVRARTAPSDPPPNALVPAANGAAALAPAPASLGDINQQLAALQELLQSAQAQRIKVEGKLRMELNVEVDF